MMFLPFPLHDLVNVQLLEKFNFKYKQKRGICKKKKYNNPRISYPIATATLLNSPSR